MTRAHAGQPLSSEIISPACRPCDVVREGNTMSDDHRKPLVDAAESETLSMCGNFMHGNRETLETSTPKGVGRSGKALGRTPDMHVSRESDDSIVPEKQANKAGRNKQHAIPAVAESVEGRGSTKGNAERTLLAPDAVPGKRGMGLQGERDAAKREGSSLSRRAPDRQLPEVRAV